MIFAKRPDFIYSIPQPSYLGGEFSFKRQLRRRFDSKRKCHSTDPTTAITLTVGFLHYFGLPRCRIADWDVLLKSAFVPAVWRRKFSCPNWWGMVKVNPYDMIIYNNVSMLLVIIIDAAMKPVADKTKIESS